MSAIFKTYGKQKTLGLAALVLAAAFAAVSWGLTASSEVKLNPSGIAVESSGAWVEDSAAWALFDRDTATAYAPASSPARVMVTLPAATDITAVKIYGNASYTLTVYDGSTGAWVSVPGLDAVALKSQNNAWNTFTPTSPLHTNKLMIEFTSAGGNAGGVKEIEIWGSEPGDPALSLKGVKTAADAKAILADSPRPAHIIELAGTPQQIDVPADGNSYAVNFNFGTDPRLVKRAYLLYDSYNADYPVSPEKRMNGLSWSGGFVPASSGTPAWTSHVEELSPSWLVKGANTIEFKNQITGRDPSSYFIRDLKVVVELENGWNALSTVDGLADNANHSAQMVTDGDLTSYFELKSNHTLDLKAERIVQPDTVRLNLWSASGAPSGTITLQYYQGSQWKNFTSGGTIDMSTLQTGWNDIKMPAAVATDTIRLNIQVAPDKKRQGAIVGGINEIDLIASPIGSRPHRGLVVTYPLNGEYFGRTAYIRGFIDPAANVSGTAQTNIEGKIVSNADGAFGLSLTKDETRFAPQNDNDPWEAAVTTTYPDGTKLAQTIALTNNLLNNSPSNTGDSSQASMSQREKFSEKVAPGQAKKIQYKGVTLDIPADAVDRETEITIIPLTETDLNRLNPGMINVTFPDAGYRFLPQGMKFKKPIKISFGYSKQLFAAGQVDDEVNMYYYDEPLLRWQRLSRVKVDAALSQVTSESDHFTDIINSTLVVPEHPEALTFNPNSIKDIKAADPSANIDLIEPPKANNQGTAELSYPIEIPKGRGAYTPDLKVTYSSNNANGWMGLGWDIPVPSIRVDTRWGVPTYDPVNESESYLIRGQALAPVFKLFDDPKAPRAVDRKFYKRVEGDFLKIVRKGSLPSNYYWEVTDKSGVKYYYGLTPQARLSDYQSSSGNIFEWFLEKVVDTNGNATFYNYYTDTQQKYLDGLSAKSSPPRNALLGEDWAYLYLDTINYTDNEKKNTGTKYSVQFIRDAGDRKDLVVGGKSGFKTAMRFRLDSAVVKYKDDVIRTYKFEYLAGDFSKSLLQKLTVKGANNSEFYSHSFDYYKSGKDGIAKAFSDSDTWGTSDSGVLTKTEEDSHARNFYEGQSFVPQRAFSRGALSGYVNADSETGSKFIDLNGDGLPDIVFNTGSVLYNLGGPEGQHQFSSPVGAPGLPAIEKEVRRTDSSGRASYLGVGSYSDDMAYTVSKSCATMADLNGDGFVDVAFGTGAYFNRLQKDNSNKFTKADNWTYSAAASLTEVDNFRKEHLHLVDPVRKWVAPFAGDIRISGTIRKNWREIAKQTVNPDGDGITVYVYRENAEIGKLTIAADDYNPHQLGEIANTTSDGVDVLGIQKDERIYFRLNSIDNGENDEIVFDPLITYTASGGKNPSELQTLKDANGRPLYVYRASSDLSFADSPEFIWPSWYTGSFTLSGRITKLKTSDDVRVIIKRSTNADFTVWDSTYKEYVLPANEERTIDLSETVQTVEGERFLFSIESDRGAVDPARASFTADAVFTEVRTCGISADYSAYTCVMTPVSDPDAKDKYGAPLYHFSPPVNYPIVYTIPKAGTITWIAPYDGAVHVGGAVQSGTGTGALTAYIVGVNALYWKQTVSAGGASSDPDVTINVSQGDQLFFEIRSEDPVDQSVSWQPEVRYTEYCSVNPSTGQKTCVPVTCWQDTGGSTLCSPPDIQVFHYPSVQLYYDDPDQVNEPFGGGFRNWYFGQWNGNNAWDQSKIAVPNTADENDVAAKYFIRMLPTPGGTPSSRGLPVWTANEDRSFISAQGLSSSRLGEGDMGGACDPGGVLRQSTGTNQNLGGSFWIGGENRSHGSTNTQIELIDVNGDGYPDLVTPDHVILNDGKTGLKLDGVAPGSFRSNYNDNTGFNLNVGGVVNAISSGGTSLMAAFTSPPGSYKIPTSWWDILGASAGYVRGRSSTKAELIDVNGDGLPDLVYQEDPSTVAPENANTITVRLNLGSRFGAPEHWYLPGDSKIRDSATRTLNVNLGIDLLGIAGASWGLALNVQETEREMVDVNGDGLLDMVSKKSDDDFITVRINQGGSFGEEEYWPIPSWRVSPPQRRGQLQMWSFILGNAASSAYLDEVMFHNDTLTNTTTETDSHGWFVNGAIPQFPRRLSRRVTPTFLIRGKDATTSSNGFKSQIDFVDIDGDGLPDHVMKLNTYYDIEIKRNLSGKANLLKYVKRPLGGSFKLEYDRKGNKVDYSNPSQLIDMQHSRWVLAKVTLNDGLKKPDGSPKHAYETRYAYNLGYYDRQEREFYGFPTVTETRGIGSDMVTVVHAYENQNYYKKGILLSSETRAGNASGPVYVATINDYGLAAQAEALSQFPYLKSTTTNFYDVQNNTIAKTTSQEYTSYDEYGNILEYVDHANGTGDDVHASIRYDQSNISEYIVNKPTSIDVKDSSGKIYRSRSALYEKGTGNLKSLKMLVEQGKNVEWTMDYDPDNLNGNLVKITYPAGDPAYNKKSDGYALSYTYDDQTQTYVVGIGDSFGYSSSADYDLRFGQPNWTRDINGNYQKNTYDDFGRLTKIYGPNAVNSATGETICLPTISFDYTAPVLDATSASAEYNSIISFARAVTTNRADTSKGCTSTTIGTATFADGLKRIIQTRKDGELNGTPGVVVAGSVEFDSLGRAVKQGQPIPGSNPLDTYEELEPYYATVFAYDTLDRTTSIVTPDGAATTMVYAFGVAPQGGTMFMTTVYDPNTKVSNPRTGTGIKISYKDVHDKIVAVREYKGGGYITTQYNYDILGQIRTVTDAKSNTTSVSYDLLGRRLTINNPDTGLTSYSYDANGNVTTRETAELKRGSKLIKYQYDYNRLVMIDYPNSVDVIYEYGSPSEIGDQSGNLAGRIKKVTDESGYELRYYGRLGETVKELRQINATNNPVARIQFETDYVFDSFGRMTQMTYPDGETLFYTYDKSGLLKKAVGIKRQNQYKYINSLTYDEFGQRASIEYGNGVRTNYTYDPLTRRLSHLKTTEPTKGRIIQDIAYLYDLVGNVMDINNTAPVPAGGEIGGPTEHHYTYDDLYQLITANGSHLPAPGKKTTYTNTLEYDTIGNIHSKLQTHLIVGTTGSQEPRETNYNMTYIYDPVIKPHAVLDAGDKKYTYDLNGNMLGWTSKTTNASRVITWNEENRVKNITDSGNGTSFLYDDQGERVVKGGGGNETVYVNRFYAVKNGDLGTKHIFAGETRVTTKLEKDGGGIQSGIPGANALLVSQGIQNAITRGNGRQIGINRRLVSSGTGTTISINPPIEKFEFFYHGDHLGSSNFITDDLGAVYQDLEYFPYGETWVEEGGSGQMPMYRFTGKELDPETGLYYFGARYYDPVLSRWISADPVLGKYLNGRSNGGVYFPGNLAFYAYAANNPIILKDVDGNEWFNTITAAQANTRAYLQVTYQQGRQRVTQYTNSPATDLRGNRAIIGEHQYRITRWSNPGAQAAGPRPVATANTEVPGAFGEYGARRPQPTQPNRTHHGIDISHTLPEGAAGVRNQPVTATGAGRVGLSRDSGPGTGNSVRVDFGGGNFDQNFHLQTRDVTQGDWVNLGQQIGTIGATGLRDPNQVHLHYQTTRGGQETDPQTTLQNPYPVRNQNREGN